MSYNIRVTIPVTEEFIGNVLITAFDSAYGACWYWADPETNSTWPVVVKWIGDDAIWVEARITFDLDDCPSTVMRYLYKAQRESLGWNPVTQETIVVGIQRMIHENNTAVLSAIKNDDAGEIDANLADCIVQYGIFGREVYS